MTQFTTMTQMATTLNVTRPEMATMLRRAGLVFLSVVFNSCRNATITKAELKKPK